MARPRRKFVVYKRKTTKSRIVYYAKIRNDEGNPEEIRISTGQSSKASAELWVQKFLDDQVNETKKKEAERLNILFGTLAEKFWEYDGAYAESRRARLRTISYGYLDTRKGITKNHLIPQWGKLRLRDITSGKIDRWVLDMVSDNRIASGTVNQRLQTLKVMLDYACAKEYITENPAKYVKPVADKYEQKGVLSKEEVQKLLNPMNWKHYKHYALNLLTLSTGMRISEVRGLQVNQVHEDYVEIHTAWEEQHGLKEPKCGSVRDIPITRIVYEVLDKTIKITKATDLVFYGSTKITPMSKSCIENNLYKALEFIGIDKIERRKRNLTFHSHRHTLNTLMRSAGIPDSKIRMITGHREQSMTERYTNFRLGDLQDIDFVQRSITK